MNFNTAHFEHLAEAYALQTQGRDVLRKDREYFQGLLETAKDPSMMAFYRAAVLQRH